MSIVKIAAMPIWSRTEKTTCRFIAVLPMRLTTVTDASASLIDRRNRDNCDSHFIRAFAATSPEKFGGPAILPVQTI
jgi:hypothetical protein